MVYLSIRLCLRFPSSVLYFSEYRSFAALSRFIPGYFILFDVMVNGTVSLIPLSDLSLLLYRNARDFCVLIYFCVSCNFIEFIDKL